jgi:hypothetical protein
LLLIGRSVLAVANELVKRKRTEALSPQNYTLSSFTRCPDAPFCP